MTNDPTMPPGIDPAALARGLTARRLSRRNMIKLGGISVGTLSLASILAACSSSSSGGSGTQAAGSVNFDPSSAGDHVNFSNWPLYIDKAHGTYPSLEKFTNDTSICSPRAWVRIWASEGELFRLMAKLARVRSIGSWLS